MGIIIIFSKMEVLREIYSYNKLCSKTGCHCAAKEREIKKIEKKFFGGVNLNEPLYS
jgi:hypothetical protein